MPARLVVDLVIALFRPEKSTAIPEFALLPDIEIADPSNVAVMPAPRPLAQVIN